jgi:hypothetical protein
MVPFADASYIAISHVWGEVDEDHMITVKEIGPIKVSLSKAKFMEDKLRDVVRDNYFWMDILCISQAKEDEDERINFTAVFPSIYRKVQKTIVVRDGSGFHSCCAKVVGELSTWAEYREGIQRWYDHWRSGHWYGGFCEGILERLWPLQEIILSRKVQFVSCDESTIKQPPGI